MKNFPNAEKTLKSFIFRMNKWEKYFGELIKDKEGITSKEEDETMKKELEIIFSLFLTDRNRKYSRLQSMGAMVPPEYGENEEILDIRYINKNEKRASIITLGDNPFKEKNRYTLKLCENGWRIDKKERFDEYEKKWKKAII